MATIEVTDEQRQALQPDRGQPVEVLDPTTQRRYVLLAREQYERVRPLLEGGPGRGALDGPAEIGAEMLQAQRAFWRDLPELVKDPRNHGRWACYHRDGRVGIAADDEPLIRECVRRGIPGDALYLAMIEPRTRAPWEPEEFEPGGHEVGDVQEARLGGDADGSS